MRLGIEHDLEKNFLDPRHPRRLASAAELLALTAQKKPPPWNEKMGGGMQDYPWLDANGLKTFP
jgi:hypothetical protein